MSGIDDLQLISLINARAFDLSQPFFNGMPHIAAVPEFIYTMTNQHGNKIYPGKISIATDLVCASTHMGTHIDALGHVSRDGMLFGGVRAAEVQNGTTGLSNLGIDTLSPILRRGVLLDVAKAAGVDVLTPETVVDEAQLRAAAESQSVELKAGDVVLIRYGWGRYWTDGARYVSPPHPGVNLGAMKWLAGFGIFACGSDTLAFEKIPSTFDVHVFSLVERGIYIMENLNLEELSESRVTEFLIVALPLRYVGATASPIRPIALVK